MGQCQALCKIPIFEFNGIRDVIIHSSPSRDGFQVVRIMRIKINVPRLWANVLQKVDLYRRVEFAIFTANRVADRIGIWSSSQIRSISIASRHIDELEHYIASVWMNSRRR